MKIFVNILLIFLLIELQSKVFGFHDFVKTDYRIGNRAEGQSHIKTVTLRAEPGGKTKGVFNTVVYRALTFDFKKKLRNGITQIKFIQQPEETLKAGQISDIQILKGGIGKKYISLMVTSQKGRGLNYKVEIYGK